MHGPKIEHQSLFTNKTKAQNTGNYLKIILSFPIFRRLGALLDSNTASNFKALWRRHLTTVREPTSYCIYFTMPRPMLANKNFLHYRRMDP